MLIAMLMSLMLGGQEPCDDDESPECAAEQIAEATRNLSLPDIQTEFDAGVQVYRAVFNGGRYGQPAVSFERRPGHSPELIIYGAEGRTFRRQVSIDVWHRVGDRSRYVGRRLEPITHYSRSCIVSADVVVQISAPRIRKPNENTGYPTPGFPQGITEASQNSCGGGLTWDYGDYLANLACEEIPECDAMGPRGQLMMAVHHLEAVFQLRGDRLAAASLFSDVGWAPSRRGHLDPVDVTEIAKWLEPEYGATLDWGSTAITAERRYNDPSPDAISHFLAERDAETGGLRYEVTEIGADSAEIGWTTGLVRYSIQIDGRWRSREAPWRQVWLRSGDNWRLWSMTVGEFAETASVQE